MRAACGGRRKLYVVRAWFFAAGDMRRGQSLVVWAIAEDARPRREFIATCKSAVIEKSVAPVGSSLAEQEPICSVDKRSFTSMSVFRLRWQSPVPPRLETPHGYPFRYPSRGRAHS